VHATAETYLGLRHGRCAIHPDTLVVCFLSSDTVTREYEVIHPRVESQQLGIRLLVGEAVPDDIVRSTDCRRGPASRRSATIRGHRRRGRNSRCAVPVPGARACSTRPRAAT
jgi:hypothetical protein